MSPKVAIITTGQPALNPRLVKEADALSDAGYEVIVIFSYWNHWGYNYTRQLLLSKKWKAHCVGGDPVEKPFVYFLSKMINLIAKKIVSYIGPVNFLSELAISRNVYFLMREAKRQRADLYIAHNLGALAPVVNAAKKYDSKCGFDAEDFHRNEVTDDKNDPRVRLVVYLEEKYIPQLDYLTASSPHISNLYASLFKMQATTVLNSFPAISPFTPEDRQEGPLKLFWFSQTIGPNRGLETIIKAIIRAKINIELHLLGLQSNLTYNTSLLKMANDAGELCKISFHEPVSPNDVFEVAKHFDIGLAAEPGFCLNNKIALSNKLFTYLQSGLVVLASNTIAQSAFLAMYPEIGKIYSSESELAQILITYDNERTLLFQTKEYNMVAGQNSLNWKSESEKFLTLIGQIIRSDSFNCNKI